MDDSSAEQVERANRRVPLLLDLTQLRVIHQAGSHGIKVRSLIFVCSDTGRAAAAAAQKVSQPGHIGGRNTCVQLLYSMHCPTAGGGRERADRRGGSGSAAGEPPAQAGEPGSLHLPPALPAAGRPPYHGPALPHPDQTARLLDRRSQRRGKSTFISCKTETGAQLYSLWRAVRETNTALECGEAEHMAEQERRKEQTEAARDRARSEILLQVTSDP